eukprot:s2052_g3.t1
MRGASITRERRDLKRKRSDVKGKDTSEAHRSGLLAEISDTLLVDCQYQNPLPDISVLRLLNAGAGQAAVARRCAFPEGKLESKLRPVLFSNEDLLSRMELSSDDAYGKAPGPAGTRQLIEVFPQLLVRPSVADWTSELPMFGGANKAETMLLPPISSAMDPPAPPPDGQLLRDDDLPGEERARLEKRARLNEPTEAYHRQAFGLQLTQHITNDVFTERQRYTTGRNAAEKKIYRDPPGFGSKEELAQKIGKTFKAAKEVPVHPTKPHLRPKRVMQVVPDQNLWGNSYVQVAFDEIPRGHTMSRDDILLRTSPDPRTTCFSFFAKRQEDADVYTVRQQYYWSNRGGFQQANETGEGKHVLLSIPKTGPEATGRKQVKFVIAPTKMKLQKLKTYRLDVQEDTKALRVNVK